MTDNFVAASLRGHPDIETFFEDEAVEYIPDNTRLEELGVVLGKFPSVTQARKNGFVGPLPEGFFAWKRGKTRFWTFMPGEWQTEEFTEGDIKCT